MHPYNIKHQFGLRNHQIPEQRSGTRVHVDPSSGQRYHFIDILIRRFQLKNTADLAERSGISPQILSRFRHGAAMPDWALIYLHEAFDISIVELKAMIRETTERELDSKEEYAFVRYRNGSRRTINQNSSE